MAISTAAAIIGGSVLSGGAALLAGGAQADAASEAAALQAEATRESVAEQRRQFNLLRGDLAPYRETGVNALAQYAALYGIGRGRIGGTIADQPVAPTAGLAPPAPAGPAGGAIADAERALEQWLEAERMEPGNQAEISVARSRLALARHTATGAHVAPPTQLEVAEGGGPAFLSREEMQAARDRFMETPGYEFRFDEGIRALDRSASATGRLRGGGYTRELTRYGQGIAAEEFGTYANRLSGLAGMGQGTTVATGTLGVQTGANIANTLQAGAARQGNALLAAGTARASGYAGAANAFSGGVENYLTARWQGLL